MASALVYSIMLISKAWALPTIPSGFCPSRCLNQTYNDHSWVPGPAGRGTLDIIYSCSTTLFLCAYTAFHPNTPLQDNVSSTLLRLELMVFTIVFPECTLYLALRQLWTAHSLRKRVNGTYRELIKGPRPGSQIMAEIAFLSEWRIQVGDLLPWSQHCNHPNEWNLEQAFFAACGGVAVDSSKFWHKDRLQFTWAGLSKLAECGVLPKVDLEEVHGRSNADVITKALTCLQASWFFIQSVARWNERLPVTLLEFHTLLHVGCTLCTYLVWWKKPYAISAPAFCREPRVRDMAALFALNCHPASRRSEARPDMAGAETCHASRDIIDEKSIRVANKGGKNNTNVYEHLQAVNRALKDLRSRGIEFTWERSEDGTIQIDGVRQLVASAIPDMNTDLRIYNAYKTGEVRSNHDIFHFFALQVLCGIYDLCYLGAWGLQFPSKSEKDLWRFLCGFQFLLILMALFWTCLRLCYVSMKGWRSRYQQVGSAEKSTSRWIALSLQDGNNWDRWMTRILMFIGVLAMVLARLYFLVESYISLRSPPRGTYETVTWTRLIPHIS